ncbi:LptA/OstA family protein [Alterisphingorhabdus coralli]|uniref:LptA/OstA family protein n=1 Tax=Alterisphingorhabdus coralli TaxID=3071408 RepID=A0AA97F6M7_9SPHN|nr:LptA/OstA family protein [Parasphingorhabdus sp. SCSIO 66989]WOE75176.1 LptA/OstA family protein [Parasphingorhabdus sp. SCSIO 66989]
MPRTSKWLFAGVAVALAAVALTVPGDGQAQSLFTHNSNAPVDFDAARIELQQRQDRVVLSGGVAINQAGLNLQASRVTVAFRDIGSTDIQRIDALGGVTVSKGDTNARGQSAIYDLDRRIITMIGNVRLNRAGDRLNGERLVIDLTTGLTSIDGRASGGGANNVNSRNGRVSGSFTVPQRNDSSN